MGQKSFVQLLNMEIKENPGKWQYLHFKNLKGELQTVLDEAPYNSQGSQSFRCMLSAPKLTNDYMMPRQSDGSAMRVSPDTVLAAMCSVGNIHEDRHFKHTFIKILGGDNDSLIKKLTISKARSSCQKRSNQKGQLVREKKIVIKRPICKTKCNELQTRNSLTSEIVEFFKNTVLPLWPAPLLKIDKSIVLSKIAITKVIEYKDNNGAVNKVLLAVKRRGFCMNVKREHGSNNIYFMVNIVEGSYYQKCHSNSCVNFYSCKMRLPLNMCVSM